MKAPNGFLHAYFLIGFSSRSLAQKRSTNPPYPQPRQQAGGIRPLAETFLRAIPSWFDTRYAVYRKSSAQHNGLLTPRIRQPWHTDSCHLIVECHFLRSDHPCSGMLTKEKFFPVDSNTPPMSLSPNECSRKTNANLFYVPTFWAGQTAKVRTSHVGKKFLTKLLKSVSPKQARFRYDTGFRLG